MTKFASAAVLCVLLSAALHAQSDEVQSVLPKKIYVGDTVEVRYSFHSSADFFEDEDESRNSRKLDLKKLRIVTDCDDYTVTDVSLERNGLMYTLVFSFIPWATGTVDFPPFDLASSVFGVSSASFMIDLQPVTVSSLIQNDDTQLRPPAAPLLVPGTIYALYCIAVAAVIALILLIRLALKWQTIRDSHRQKKLRRAYAKNARELFRRLRRLERNGSKLDDASFCAELQQAVRRYLETRFGYRFTSVSTSQLMNAFDSVSAGLMSLKKQSAAESFAGILHRTDYIRYARGSIDSSREPADMYQAKLGDGERRSLISIVKENVEAFEEVQHA